VDKQSEEVDKLDRELVDIQKELFKAVEDYGKVSFGPGYLKKLEISLSIIEKRLEVSLSTQERKLLV
jgi:ATP-dependent protease HslVU (ClpYQ) peptidase subunit